MTFVVIRPFAKLQTRARQPVENDVRIQGLKIVKLVRNINEVSSSIMSGAVTIGNFDGVHRGHAQLVKSVIQFAEKIGGPSVVFTFDPHPAKLLRPDIAPVPLTWTERKAELLGKLGIDVMVAYPTDRNLLNLPPAAFFSEILLKSLRAKAVVEGPNFFFGKNRAGDTQLLGQLCQENNIAFEIVEPIRRDEDYVSSSRIRSAIAGGQIEQANQMLTSPYKIRGTVGHGAGRGATIGFPTANLQEIDTLIPHDGVYAGQVEWERKMWPAAINIGPNPTFGETSRKVEIHLIDFDDSLYEKPMEVDFLAKLRDIRTFNGRDELCEQLSKDIEAAKTVFSQTQQ